MSDRESWERQRRITQGDVRGHVPREDRLPGPQIDFLDYRVFVRSICQTAVSGQIRLDGFRRDEIGVTLRRNREFVQVRRGSVGWSDRLDQSIVLVVDDEVPSSDVPGGNLLGAIPAIDPCHQINTGLPNRV